MSEIAVDTNEQTYTKHPCARFTAASELRDAQRVAVGVFEPRDSGAARRRPDALLVLAHARISLQSNACHLQPLCRCDDVRDLPSQHRVFGGDHFVHNRDAQHRAVRVERQSELVLADEAQAEGVAVEAPGLGRSRSRKDNGEEIARAAFFAQREAEEEALGQKALADMKQRETSKKESGGTVSGPFRLGTQIKQDEPIMDIQHIQDEERRVTIEGLCI